MWREKFVRVSAPEVEHGLFRPLRYVENRDSAQRVSAVFSLLAWRAWNIRNVKVSKQKTMKEGSFVCLGLASSTTSPNTLRLRSCRCFSRGEGGALGTWTGVKALEDADVFGHDRCHQLFGGGQILHETGSTDQEGEKREDAIGFKQPSGQFFFSFSSSSSS